MRFLFLFLIAVIMSSSLWAQNTDTTRVVKDSTGLVIQDVIPVSIQVIDSVAKKIDLPVITVTPDSTNVSSSVDTLNVPSIAKDTVVSKSDSSSTGVNAVNSPAVIIPNAPLDPNYTYSSQNYGLALAKVGNKEQTDTIVFLNGDKVLANVKKFTFRDLFYGFPGDVKMVAVDRRYVQKIIYKYGRVETISAREVDIREVGGWKDVKVLKKRTAAIKDMVDVGEVEGVDEGTREKYVDARDLERSATITIQKKAALLGATIVLITTRDVRRPYGDPPYVRLVARAYKPK
ncbi:hypothetical protein [Williamwhitmania taraxaci]|uniref:Uncharacterized protein n=1 Tax=Williamwhitmania taraxaci TaxID=1640674 RepID=A0A1G6I0E6_9BACT|nr:hypothetical protein [Williamwhitmania taraxaci]SDB99934.1 hypothetical protein SAMN05216323_101413 [Williamwhitmania taraxaci]